MEKCFPDAPLIHSISQFHCIEPTGAGFVNCRLYSSQSSCHTEGPPEVFPYDSCDSDATSDDDEDYSEYEEEDEKECTDNEDEEQRNMTNKMEKESEEEDEISDKNVDNDKDNYVEIKLGIPEVLSHPIH